MGGIGVPQPGEYQSVSERYVARVRGVADPVQELEIQRGRVLARLSTLTDEQAEYRYAAFLASRKTTTRVRRSQIGGHSATC